MEPFDCDAVLADEVLKKIVRNFPSWRWKKNVRATGECSTGAILARKIDFLTIARHVFLERGVHRVFVRTVDVNLFEKRACEVRIGAVENTGDNATMFRGNNRRAQASR